MSAFPTLRQIRRQRRHSSSAKKKGKKEGGTPSKTPLNQATFCRYFQLLLFLPSFRQLQFVRSSIAVPEYGPSVSGAGARLHDNDQARQRVGGEHRPGMSSVSAILRTIRDPDGARGRGVVLVLMQNFCLEHSTMAPPVPPSLGYWLPLVVSCLPILSLPTSWPQALLLPIPL